MSNHKTARRALQRSNSKLRATNNQLKKELLSQTRDIAIQQFIEDVRVSVASTRSKMLATMKKVDERAGKEQLLAKLKKQGMEAQANHIAFQTTNDIQKKRGVWGLALKLAQAFKSKEAI